jgi:hypothetical protein
VFRPLNI